MNSASVAFPPLRFRALVCLLLCALASACSSSEHPPFAEGGDGTGGVTAIDACATPNEGCSCPSEGMQVDCGRVTDVYGDYITCSQGTRSCSGGKWGACIGDRIVQKANTPQSSLASLGSSGTCPAGFDPCDPYCNQATDSPGGFDAGPGFNNSNSTLELKKTVLATCTSLAIVPSATLDTVTQISPVVASPASITLSAVLSPPTCLASPYPTTWTIDKFDVAHITGTNNTNGSLSVVSPYAGTITVTAYAAGFSATTNITVKVNALEAPTTSGAASPNAQATSTQIGLFGTASAPLSGTTSSSATWLYPYAATYFPLGLPAPTPQYLYSTSGGGAGAVKVSLRWPVNQSALTADFNYSLIVKESNAVSQSAGVTANTLDPQVVIPQVAWRAFEQTARGQDADLLVQRLTGANTLEQENRRAVHFVDGQLKGTVFYNSYSSPLGGNIGAVLSIAPGATTPTLAVQPSSKCTVCHTLNLDGTRLIANGFTTSKSWFNQSRRYDTSTAGPSPTVLNTYSAASTDTENVPGDRYTFGAPFLDGTLYMTHGGRSGGDSNWRAPPDYSNLYSVANPSAAISVTNWPSNVLGVSPRFSPDGTKLAFGFWGGNALNQSPSGTLSSDSTGKTLTVVDFSCSSPPCSSSSSGWSVSNARNVTPAVASGTNSTTGTVKVAWPSFVPAGDAVLYQRQYRTSRSKPSDSTGVLTNNWSPSDINTVAGALAEIWMSNVPANKNTTATPTRLLALNGLNSAGTSYLPTAARAVSPVPTAYHAANASFTITQADNCSNTGTASGVNDYQLNYLPAVNPTEAGGKIWVVFTSRRMYGNVAYDDPWDAEPGYTCNSGIPPSKKLWVAAVDKTWTPGTDPSHPAFYLPGQELKGGNSNGYWVNAQCAALGATCSTNDDCCGGTGSSATARCEGTTHTCKAISACSTNGDACASTADCCTGLICGGTGTCVPPEFYTTQTYQREYVANCPPGQRPIWRFFEWQSTIPSGTSIGLAVQTKLKPTDSYLPGTALSIGTISASTSSGVWAHGTSTVDQTLQAAGMISQPYLLVSLTFNPDSTGLITPSLSAWRQNYDCVDAE